MNILLVPDSFKGSLTSIEAAEAIKVGLLRVFPEARLRALPMADGGEGTVRALTAALGGRILTETVTGPLGDPVTAEYGLCPNGTVLLELAQCAGLTQVPPALRNPLHTGSWGLGELLKIGLDRGCRRFYLGLGGSAVNDGGLGMAKALGGRFYDAQGRELSGRGRDLDALEDMDLSGLDPRLRECRITVLCDVQNPLCGPQGAAVVYGPQKGADPEAVALLDRGLAGLARLWKMQLGTDYSSIPGAGAAGGLGAGIMAFCGGSLAPGAETVLKLTGFYDLPDRADLVIAGEGCLDGSTGYGKAVSAVARGAKAAGVPVLVLAGSVIGQPDFGCYDGVEASICRITTLPEAMEQASALLADAAERAFRLIRLGQRLTD